MLGEIVAELPAVAERTAAARATETAARIEVRGLAAEPKLRDATFELHPGEVLGSWPSRVRARTSSSTCSAAPSGRAVESCSSMAAPSPSVISRTRSGPASSTSRPIERGPAHAAFGPENIALPFTARIDRWGLIDLGRERQVVDGAIDRLQIDARAGREVRRLSGGNQQKVTIARWVAGGVRTMLCFDPTRGIDIWTKQQIYVLLRISPRPARRCSSTRRI